MNEEIKNLIDRMDNLDRRLQNVEKELAGKSSELKVKQGLEKDYSSLKGGIILLIDDHFFDTPKSLRETIEQLKIKGYHYKKGSIQVALTRDFMKKKRTLTRIEDGKKYKYVIRK